MHQYVANKNVFSKCVKLSLPKARSLRTSGKEFHALRPATEKAHWPYMLNQYRGMTRSPRRGADISDVMRYGRLVGRCQSSTVEH